MPVLGGRSGSSICQMTLKNNALLFRNCFPGKSQTAGDCSAFLLDQLSRKADEHACVVAQALV